MSLAVATLKLDVKLQARSKLYAIGIVSAVFLGLVGRFLIGPDYGDRALPILYLLGLGGTSYIFGGSLVLMEKSQGTLQALRVTPLTTNAYLASKVITLTSFAALEGFIVQAVGFWGVPFDPLPLLAGILSLGMLNTFVGMGQVAPHDSVLSFLIPGVLIVGSISQLPFLYVLEVGPPAVWYLIPTQAPLLLMLAAFRELTTWQWFYAIGVSVGMIVLAAWWAKRQFARYIGLQDG